MEKEDIVWRKSSFSGPNGGDCVEWAEAPAAVLVRDSKDPSGPRLTFSREAWTSFVTFTFTVAALKP